MTEDRIGFGDTTSTTSESGEGRPLIRLRHLLPRTAGEKALVALFVASAVATVYFARSMAAEMMWMRMPDQTWLGVGAMFAGMWTVMMIAMMLPAMGPTFARQRPAFAIAYFLVWALAGIVIYPIGVLVAERPPVSAGVAIIAAALLQLSPWKMRSLSCCRTRATSGFRAAADCILCCSGFMLALLAIGMMNLVAMAVFAAAIAIERLSPRPVLAARISGVLMLAYGTALVIH